MTDIAGIPYLEASFAQDGAPQCAVTVPGDITDVIVISHGWNSNPDEARDLYRRLFENFAAEGPLDHLAVIGVLWPSKRFGGTAPAVAAKLDELKDVFPDAAARLDSLKSLVPALNDHSSARRAFADGLRSLLNPAAANSEDASDQFFSDDGNELMKNLSLSGFHAAAINLLNFTTYFEMKTRAGNIGKLGVAPLIDSLPDHVERIHLVGHSFGGRLVTSAAGNSSTDRIRSLSLLQAAFSHNGFSRTKHGFFRSVIDQHRIHGPILITHTSNDKAVGLAYPLASRISGDHTAALGDRNDRYGGIGRNGALFMEPRESSEGALLPHGAAYQFCPGRVHNLESSAFIGSHGDVTGPEVAHALRAAITG
jgi:hypothetical protein